MCITEPYPIFDAIQRFAYKCSRRLNSSPRPEVTNGTSFEKLMFQTMFEQKYEYFE